MQTIHRCAIFVALLSTMALTRGAELGPVRTASGLVRGTISATNDPVQVFRGIPYAASAAGANRWKPPQAVVPWDGVRACTEFGPACPQLPYPKESAFYRDPEPQSEDCLSLNVWSAAVGAKERQPVMVWIHGGALTRGSGAIGVYDATALAKKGVVVVTINYRLGPLGFFAHSELTAESPEHASGNYGFLDQIAALKWVHENIARFGGDAGCVTIFGESAGAQSVCALVASPLAKGLFHRAIAESGSAFRPVPNLAAAERQGALLTEAAGAKSLNELRQVPGEKLLDVASSRSDGRGGPNVDGWFLPEDALTIFAHGRQNNVPTIVGSNANEMTTLSPVASRPKTLKALDGQIALLLGDPAEVKRLYPAASDDDATRAYLDIVGDVAFTLPARMWARWDIQAGGRAYLYQFTHVTSLAASAGLGAPHAAEIAYVFNNLDRLKRPFDETDRKLADTMSTYWTAFARTGDPNAAGLPEWKPYDAQGEPAIDFGATVKLASHVRQEKLDVLEGLMQKRRQAPAP